MLATLSARELDRYLARGLEAWTAQTIVDCEVLKKELRHVRERGFATSDRELDDEVRSVAASITGPTGDVIAAVSISCPATRLPDALIATYARRVVAAAKAIGIAKNS